MGWQEVLMNPWLWGFFLATTLLGISVIRKTPLRKVPVINNKKSLMLLSAVMLFIIFGGATMLGFGTVSKGVSAGDWVISDLQVTTDFEQNASEHSTIDDLIDFRYYDADVSSDSHYEIRAGEITVTRTGSLPADSCTVKAIMPPRYDDEDGTTSPDVTRNIFVENAMGVYTVHIATGTTTGTNATTSSPKESNTLQFAEGVSKAYFSVYASVDEEGHDALNQYSSKDVVMDVCGKPFTFRIHHMDA